MAVRRKKPDPPEGEGVAEAFDFPRPLDEEGYSLEELLTAKWGFQLDTATPVQRAACRVLQGIPMGELEHDPDVRDAFGGVVPRLIAPPHMFVLMCAIRCAKSLLSMAHAVYRSQRLDVSKLKAGDGVRLSILSTGIDIAKATFTHLVGALEASPYLASLIEKTTADTVVIRHPSGRPIEIKVVAMSHAGSTLVGRFSAGVVFDEAPRLSSDPDHVETLTEALKAVHGRLLPGSTILLPGSPYEPHGEVFDLFERYFGAPDAQCVVMRANGPVMNPFWWTPERCEQVRATDADTYRTDVLADFRKGKASLFDYRDLDSLTADVEEERSNVCDYVAALAPGTIGARWTLVVERATAGHRDVRGVEHQSSFAVASALEWTAEDGLSLKPSTVLPLVARELARWGLDSAIVSEEVPDELIDLAFEAGITLCKDALSPAELLEHLEEVRTLVEGHRYRLPHNVELRRDLLTVRRIVSEGGVPSIKLPETKDGRRCDYIPLLARCRKFSAVTVEDEQKTEDDMAKAIRKVDEWNERRIERSLHKLSN